MSDKIIVRVIHLRQLKICIPRSRVWFKERNLDWQDFVFNGIDLEILKQFDDIYVKQLVELLENGR